MPRAVFFLITSALTALALAACGGASREESGLSWSGAPLPVAARLSAPTADSLRAHGWEALVRHKPRRMLRVAAGEWGDTLWLLEFKDDLSAYAAFQQLSPDDEAIASGEAVCGERVCFRRGRWIGSLDGWSWKGGDWFAARLTLPGPEPEGNLPAIFGSLLHQDRIPGSERVLSGEFMGLAVSDPVYAMKADCRGDTAWVYAAPRVPPGFAESLSRQPGWGVDTLRGLWKGLEVHSELTELPPVILRFSGKGMVGVEGCFDEELTSYWLKMQARGLKNLK